MAVQPLPFSLEEFHRRFDGAKPAYEYWYGAAVQKSMPTVLHGIVQAIMMMLLEKAGWNTASEVRLKIVPHAEPVPDVIAVRGKFRGPYPTVAPDVCVEILSPRDVLAQALDKAKSYIRWGTQCVWIIDPERRTAWTLSREGCGEPAWVSPAGTLRVGETEIGLPTLFAEVDRKIEWNLDEDQEGPAGGKWTGISPARSDEKAAD
jgi:Uma2 family endonuclease